MAYPSAPAGSIAVSWSRMVFTQRNAIVGSVHTCTFACECVPPDPCEWPPSLIASSSVTVSAIRSTLTASAGRFASAIRVTDGLRVALARKFTSALARAVTSEGAGS